MESGVFSRWGGAVGVEGGVGADEWRDGTVRVEGAGWWGRDGGSGDVRQACRTAPNRTP